MKERGSMSVCVWGGGGVVCVRMFVGGEGGSVLCVYERENVCVCVCTRLSGSVCVCARLCVHAKRASV